MDYTKIIEEIKAELKGESKEDLAFLEKQAMKYRDHKHAKQIIDEISKMAYDALPQEKKDKMTKALFYNGKRLDIIFREAKAAADVHDYSTSNKLMKGIVSTIQEQFADTSGREYYSFRNPLEEYIYIHLFNPATKFHKTPFNFSEMLRFNGYVLIELKKVDEAIEILKKAVKYNPVNAEAYFELAEAYKLKKNNDELLNTTRDIIEIATSTSILARCYTNLGFYCIEIGDYKSAVAFYYQSMRCKENPAIVGELNFIRQKTGKDIEKPTNIEIEAAFSKYDLKPGANQKVVAVAFALGKKAIDNNLDMFAKLCLGIVCDLTDDEEVKKLYAQIK